MKKRNPSVFTASYSTLTAWEQGDKERAISMYFHLPVELPVALEKAFERGKAYHDAWRQETASTGCLPQLFGGKKLNNPVLETKQVIPLSSWLEFVVFPDVREDGRLIDYKTGEMSAGSECAKLQGGIYSLGLLIQGHKIEKFDVYRYTPWLNQKDYASRWVTKTYLKEAESWLKTQSLDMHSFLLTNGIYEHYQSEEVIT